MALGRASESQAHKSVLFGAVSGVPLCPVELIPLGVQINFLFQLEHRDGRGREQAHPCLPPCVLPGGGLFLQPVCLPSLAWLIATHHGSSETLIVCKSLQDGGSYVEKCS